MLPVLRLALGRIIMVEGKATIVVLTYNRREQALSTLQFLSQLPGGWPIIVVDNGSTDGTANAIRARYPAVMLIRMRRNLGAAARNIGVAYAHTPYVAFCDDDTQWEPGALERAVTLLDQAPTVAALSANVQVGPDRRPDPTCQLMAESPLPSAGLPGPRLMGFMAGACVMRTRAFSDVGGYWPPFFIGGEETLMALDLTEQGWDIVYAAQVVTRHFPSVIRDTISRQRLLLRNAIWVAWLRRPVVSACRISLRQLGRARLNGALFKVLGASLVGMPRVLRRRRVISPATEHLCRLMERAETLSALKLFAPAECEGGRDAASMQR